MVKHPDYVIEAPMLPAEDGSGSVGPRLLRLLSVQAERNLAWVHETCARAGVPDTVFFVPSGAGMTWPLHILYNAATSAGVFGLLARFGTPGLTTGGVSRERLAQMAAVMVRAVTETHPVSGSPRAVAEWWDKGFTLRTDYLFGLGAWLVIDDLDPQTRGLVARILEHDADLYNHEQAPALLYDDTQAESNAWTASGLALACCMLKQHPRRRLWDEKAREFMISAYATDRDVTSFRVVDGKPLREWLSAPNAFPDYTVENHGFIHPDYIAAFSEMVRTAICYRLAGAAVPEASTFNADKVFDVLLRFNLPDGNHHYVQGSDYTTRRLDSFFQACSIVALKPDPLREAGFLRSLARIETMASERPGMHMSGNQTFPFDFGTAWGLTEHYLLRRMYGSPEALPEEQIEAGLAGVHVNEAARFAIHRTARTLSSFSWHAIDRGSQVMGVTLPLDTDVLCCPPPDGCIGDVVEVSAPQVVPTRVLSHTVASSGQGFSVCVELARCAGRISQHCAFISLPDGRSVYFEQRRARQEVSISSADSGSVAIYDDLRWPFQKHARTFHCRAGILDAEAGQGAAHAGNWLNVDGRMGFVAQGLDAFQLVKSEGVFDSWRLAFMLPGTPCAFTAGRELSRFALVSCPNQSSGATAELAQTISAQGWHVSEDGVLALALAPYIVYANFTVERHACATSKGPAQFGPRSSGWLDSGLCS